MPAVGDQHSKTRTRTSLPGFYEEPRREISTYTAQEIATLQSRLEKQLGPEFLSSRSGPGGKKVHYVAAEKCIQLANAVFGFNGWSSQIIDFQVDFIDENPQTLKVSLGLSVVVRVTLKDGTFHEDIGYGHVENFKAKAAAFEKAKKEGTTDALKRALRNFGNVLGNCIYDKEYLRQVSKVKPFSPKWSEDNLFRHESFTVPPNFRNRHDMGKDNDSPILDGLRLEKSSESGLMRTGSEEFFEDDFGDFDEADFGVADPDCHPDEVVLNGEIGSNNTATTSELNTIQIPLPAAGPPFPKQAVLQAAQSAQSNHSKINGSGLKSCKEPNQNKIKKQPLGNSTPAGRILNQPNRVDSANQLSSLNSPVLKQKSTSNSPQETDFQDNQTLGNGFYSARAVNMFSPTIQNQNISSTGLHDSIPPHAPLFNPHAESPSIRKTPGVDHRISKPLTKDLKHVPSASQVSTPSGLLGSHSSGIMASRSNILNPGLDGIRRIGAPGSPSPNGLNSSKGTGFKIPMKRTTDGGIGKSINGPNRIPLETLNSNTNGAMIDVADPKRQKLHG